MASNCCSQTGYRVLVVCMFFDIKATGQRCPLCCILTVPKLDHTDLNQTSMSRAQSTNLGMMYASIRLDARLTGKFFSNIFPPSYI